MTDRHSDTGNVIDIGSLEVEAAERTLAEWEKVFLGGIPVDVPRLLQEVNANPQLARARGRHGRTLLHFATNENHFDLAQVLIALGADVNAIDDVSGSPLHVAVGDPTLITLLLKHGASPNLRDGHGATPLYWAAINHALAIIKLLLTHGAVPQDDHTRSYIQSLQEQNLL